MVTFVTKERNQAPPTRLILTRRYDQRIRIETPAGEVVWVTVVDWDRQKVRLSVEASRSVAVDREEVYERKMLEPHGGEAGGA